MIGCSFLISPVIMRVLFYTHWIFFDISCKFIQYTIHWDKTQMLRKFSLVKINVTKNSHFFLSQAPIHHSFTFVSRFLNEWRFRLVFMKIYIFDNTKSMDSLTLKRHNSSINKNNRKATHSFAPRLLLFKLQEEVWKFNDSCVSYSSPKLLRRQTF